jgi:adenylyltransferase/sulfurtransferase
MSEVPRHDRQIRLPRVGAVGQARLAAARVAVVGCGALGSVAAELLGRAGVGHLTLVDRDVVERSNLQRQALFTDADAAAAREKASAAAAALRAIDPGLSVKEIVEDLGPQNAERLLGGHDVIVDGTDSFAARFLINDVAFRSGIPWVYGAAVGTEGVFGVFRPGKTPCLRCFLELLPPPGASPTCDTAGVLGPLTHLVASVEASEALKLLLGAEEAGLPPARGIGVVSLWGPSGPSVRSTLACAVPWTECPTCALGRFPALSGEGSEFARILCGRNSVQLVPEHPRKLDMALLAERLVAAGEVTRSSDSITVRVPEGTITLFSDGRAIVEGTLEPERGRAILARYVGL